mmetsp:Transcript_24583/g.24181  ORF Transcript_24583/g.24181 Transcript_24583/m.24181 type:complete len:206 (+) Transcript_24583:359-976(+)
MIIYLARIPKAYQGFFMGIGMLLILLMQEKDSFSFKYALIPVIFNNLLLIVSQCIISTPLYVNTRMVLFGALWYIVSIIAFIGSFQQLLDFFYIFEDLFLFSTGISMFYTWQTLEKNDITFTKFALEQTQLYQKFLSYIERQEEESELDNLRQNHQKSLKKSSMKKEQKKEKKKLQFSEENEVRIIGGSTGSHSEKFTKMAITSV